MIRNKYKRLQKRILLVLCITAALLLVIFGGLTIYNRIGYRPMGSINEDTVDTILFTFSGNYHGGEYVDIVDYTIDSEFFSMLESDLNNLRVFNPHDNQDLLYYGANYIQYTIIKQDGSSHVVELVGLSKNDINTGYYIDAGAETYQIMKAGIPSYYVKIDGIIYDIRNREIYENLRDNANILINQYMQAK